MIEGVSDGCRLCAKLQILDVNYFRAQTDAF